MPLTHEPETQASTRATVANTATMAISKKENMLKTTIDAIVW